MLSIGGEGVKNRSDVRRFWHSGDSTSKRVLDVLESFYLRQWKIIVQCVAVVKFRVNDRNCSVCKYVK